MPSYLRPSAPVAADAVLVGDPGRALLLAQELLAEPKMSNHARGLWGYSGETPAGHPLTVQSTGLGGPSAALVLGDLVELGVRRTIRAGTATGFDGACRLGELLVVDAAIAVGGSAASHGAEAGERVAPDPLLAGRLANELGDEGRRATVASFDAHPGEQSPPAGAEAADLQTAPLLARARSLGIEAAAVLIIAEIASPERRLERDSLEEAEKRAGRAAARVLST
jgi:purine-nucleoside phosphorylase